MHTSTGKKPYHLVSKPTHIYRSMKWKESAMQATTTTTATTRMVKKKESRRAKELSLNNSVPYFLLIFTRFDLDSVTLIN